MEVQPRTVDYYVKPNNQCPFKEWLTNLLDPVGRAQIDKRIARLRLGNLGEWKDVGEGVIELIFKGPGPGYRIYIGQKGSIVVILLNGGDKSTQRSDISNAKEYWREHNDC